MLTASPQVLGEGAANLRVLVFNVKGEDLIEDSLKVLEEEFAQSFVRIHRNALVNTKFLERIARDATGQHFVLVTSRNYHFYWRDIHTTTKTDFAFDEAHIADYRITHDNYVPLVRTAEPTSYTLVTSDPDLGKKGPQGLVGHSIITMPSPSLGYVLLLELYPNPVSQPDIRSTAAAWRDAIDSVFGGDDDAAIIPTWLKNQYPNLVTVKTTRQFAGTCVTAGADVPEEVRQKVKDALLKLDADEETAKLLIELGVSKFVPATPKDYEGNEKLLKAYLGY